MYNTVAREFCSSYINLSPLTNRKSIDSVAPIKGSLVLKSIMPRLLNIHNIKISLSEISKKRLLKRTFLTCVPFIVFVHLLP